MNNFFISLHFYALCAQWNMNRRMHTYTYKNWVIIHTKKNCFYYFAATITFPTTIQKLKKYQTQTLYFFIKWMKMRKKFGFLHKYKYLRRRKKWKIYFSILTMFIATLSKHLIGNRILFPIFSFTLNKNFHLR